MAKQAKISSFRFEISNPDGSAISITRNIITDFIDRVSSLIQTATDLYIFPSRRFKVRIEHAFESQTIDNFLPNTFFYKIKFGNKGTTGLLNKETENDIDIREDDYTLKDMYMGIFLPLSQRDCYIAFASLRSDQPPGKGATINLLKKMFDQNNDRLILKNMLTPFFLKRELDNFDIKSFTVIDGNTISQGGIVSNKMTVNFAMRTATPFNNIANDLRSLLERCHLWGNGNILKLYCASDRDEHPCPVNVQITNNFEEELMQALIKSLLTIDDESSYETAVINELNCFFREIIDQNARL